MKLTLPIIILLFFEAFFSRNSIRARRPLSGLPAALDSRRPRTFNVTRLGLALSSWARRVDTRVDARADPRDALPRPRLPPRSAPFVAPAAGASIEISPSRSVFARSRFFVMPPRVGRVADRWVLCWRPARGPVGAMTPGKRGRTEGKLIIAVMANIATGSEDAVSLDGRAFDRYRG
jgi:hypothetical protein